MLAGRTGDVRTLEAILGAAGGLAVFAAGVWAIVRGIVQQTDATRDNTQAIQQLTSKMDVMAKQVNDNTVEIARLKVRRRWAAAK